MRSLKSAPQKAITIAWYAVFSMMGAALPPDSTPHIGKRQLRGIVVHSRYGGLARWVGWSIPRAGKPKEGRVQREE